MKKLILVDDKDKLKKILENENKDSLIHIDFKEDNFISLNLFGIESEFEVEKWMLVEDLINFFSNYFGEEIFGPRVEEFTRLVFYSMVYSQTVKSLPDFLFSLDLERGLNDKVIDNISEPQLKLYILSLKQKYSAPHIKEIIPFFTAKFSFLVINPIGLKVFDIESYPSINFYKFLTTEGKSLILDFSNLFLSVRPREFIKAFFLIKLLVALKVLSYYDKKVKVKIEVDLEEIGEKIKYLVDEVKGYKNKF